MDALTLGVPGTLAGLLLAGLSPSGPVPETDCTEVYTYDFTTLPAPILPDGLLYWLHPNFALHGDMPEPEAAFPDLALGRNVLISGGELVGTGDLFYSSAVFASVAPGAGDFDFETLFDAYGHTRRIYAEIGLNFHAALYDAHDAPSARLLTIYPNTVFQPSCWLSALDVDGPPSGQIEIRLSWTVGAGAYEHASVLKPRSFADGLHTFRVELTPALPVVPGSTTNQDLVPHGIVSLYIDDVLEFETTTTELRITPSFVAAINDAFTVGGVGVGRDGFAGGYHYLRFGYCDVVAPETPEPPTPGGTGPIGVNPALADLPAGVMRVIFELRDRFDQIVARAETTLRNDADWHGGFMPGTLLEVGDVDRELGYDGELRPVTARVVVADQNHEWRHRADNVAISECVAHLLLVSDEVRYAKGEPYRRFAGRVTSHGALPDMLYEFELQDLLTLTVGDLDQVVTVPTETMSKTEFGGLDDAMDGRALPTVLGHVTDTMTGAPKGLVSPIIVGRINFSTFPGFVGGINKTVIATVLSHGPIATNGLFDGYYNTPTAPDVRLPLPPGVFSASGPLWAPGMAGWEATGAPSDFYVEYLGRRLYPVFIDASHPLAAAYLEGRIILAFNPYGLADDAGGSSTYFSDPPDIWQWVWLNMSGIAAPWKTGPYNGIPLLEPGGYSVLNTDSITRTRERQHARRIGGYPMAGLLGRGGQAQAWKHISQEICSGSDMQSGIDRHGRAMLDTEDPTADAVATLTHLHDIETGTFRVSIDRSKFFDRLEHFIGYRHTPPTAPRATPAEGAPQPERVAPYSEWAFPMRVVTNTAAITSNQGKIRTRQVHNYWCYDTGVASDLETRWMARAAGPDPALDGPRVFELTGPMRRLLGLELGDNIRLTHTEGLALGGYVNKLARVMRIVDQYQTRRIRVYGYILLEELFT